MTTIHLELEPPLEAAPSIYDDIVVDMTSHAEVTADVIRAEFRKVTDPISGPKRPSDRIEFDSFVIGLLDAQGLPEEGQPFRMSYHILNNISNFGKIDSNEPITNLVIEGNCYYFSTSEGQWKLKILDVGN
jgi:hypothetical protein